MNLRKHINLLVGFFVFSSVLMGIMGLVLLLSAKGMFNPEYKLMAVLEDGIGIRKGTEVLYEGVRIGSVEELTLKRGKEAGAVLVTLRIDEKYKPFITDITTAYIMRDKNLVSDRVINLESSQWSEQYLDDGDTLKVSHPRDIETVMNSVTELTDKINDLINGIENVVVRVSDTSTTIGAMLGSRSLYEKLVESMAGLDNLLQTGDSAVSRVDQVGRTLSEEVPLLFGRLDTLSSNFMLTSSSARIIASRFEDVTGQVDTLLGGLNDLVQRGEGDLDQARKLVDAISQFWPIRGKMAKLSEKEFPLLPGGI